MYVVRVGSQAVVNSKATNVHFHKSLKDIARNKGNLGPAAKLEACKLGCTGGF